MRKKKKEILGLEKAYVNCLCNPCDHQEDLVYSFYKIIEWTTRGIYNLPIGKEDIHGWVKIFQQHLGSPLKTLGLSHIHSHSQLALHLKPRNWNCATYPLVKKLVLTLGLGPFTIVNGLNDGYSCRIEI